MGKQSQKWPDWVYLVITVVLLSILAIFLLLCKWEHLKETNFRTLKEAGIVFLTGSGILLGYYRHYLKNMK